ncbi:MAG: hypothetical protein ACRD01_10060 [Terriglobales bacterium]
MTTMDLEFRFAGALDEAQLRALGRLPDVYGIRALRVDEPGRRIAVEYDATRLDAARVHALLRAAGVAAEPALAGQN